MFKRVAPQTKIGKNKAMLCTPGFIWVKQGVAAYTQRATGEQPHPDNEKSWVDFQGIQGNDGKI